MAGSIEDFKDSLVLEKDKKNEEHDALVAHVGKMMSKSRSDMAKYYSTWDYHDTVFRSKRDADTEDRKSAAKGGPVKVIVPLTFAQTMSFVAFCVQTVTQNKRFYELEHEGNKNAALKEPMELVLERDCRRNQWNAFLVQFFLDTARFWLGAAEICYKEEAKYIRVTETESTGGAFGEEKKKTTSGFKRIPTFIGNKVYPVSPYRIFPDTSLPLTRFQEGRFCGSEDMFSLSSLKADDTNLFNLDMIPRMSEDGYKKRSESSRIDPVDFVPRAQQKTGNSEEMTTTGSVVVTKVVFDMAPDSFEIDGKKPLGDEKHNVRYICWIANDKTVIRFEEAYYLHGQFPYVIAQYLPDQHQTVNEGLSATCDQITALITWKLNAHLQSQKNSVQSKFIIDPAGIDTKNLDSSNPYIYLKKSASQTGVDRYIKQFITTDVTQGVMQDISMLKDLLEGITGISGMIQGQSSSGRRSATQDRVVAQGAASRVKTTLSAIWDAAFENIGKQFISNNRQEMDEETFYRIVGEGPFPPTNQTKEELFAAFRADPISIATSEDFFVFDATLQSEKAFLAQSLQEILMQIMSNPAVMQVLNYGPEQVQYLFNQVFLLRGVTAPTLPSPPKVMPGLPTPIPLELMQPPTAVA